MAPAQIADIPDDLLPSIFVHIDPAKAPQYRLLSLRFNTALRARSFVQANVRLHCIPKHELWANRAAMTRLATFERLDSYERAWFNGWAKDYQEAYAIEVLSKVSAIRLTFGDHRRRRRLVPEAIGVLTQLENLTIRFFGFKGSIPESVGQLTNLKTLNLISNKLSGDIPQVLAQLILLTRLDISNNPFTSGPIPSFLASLTQLEELSIDYTSRTGPLPLWIGTAFPRMQVLGLAGNKLAGSVPESLAEMRALRALYLQNNDLSGLFPVGVFDLEELDPELFKIDVDRFQGLPEGWWDDDSMGFSDLEDDLV
ncbi:hypothetical protein BC830DRAFT_1173422 [Chytriomyces sp. MP71]|nr:hypothetical protein BC830DRAFT_1173422 [Chytriomyces sp. MP71]